ncbi:equilibrative nucleoside transporter 1-like [Lytechinus pictus]|uniref:equilibrative nucleoside transporter 1-like n=1 Tax=Lytechinus pictus TaxID=7653 RepID=UPI0030B9B832
MDGQYSRDSVMLTPMENEDQPRSYKETPKDEPEIRRAPKDRFGLVTIIFIFQGLGTLYPWNSFITAERYFTDHKFANVSDSVDFKDNFTLYVAYGNFTPYIFFLFLSLFFPTRTSKIWCFAGLVMMFFLFIITTFLAILDTSQWPGMFFWITMITIVLFSASAAIYQSGLYCLLAKLPPNYIQSYLVGQGFGGTFVAIAAIISIAIAGTQRSAAVGYFTTAVVVLFICIVSYCLLYKMTMVKYHLGVARGNEAADEINKAASGLVDNSSRSQCCLTSINLAQIFWDIKMQIFNIWMTFFVTLSLFPGVLVEIQSSNDHKSEFVDLYFTPLVCFLTFNFGDFLGSLIPGIPRLRWKFPRLTWIWVTLRLVFVIFIFCNYRPDRRTLPIWIDNDIGYAILVVIFSLSNGYLKTIIMMDGPSSVSNPTWASKAASMMAFFLILGIFCGVQFSRFFPWIVTI